MVTSEAHDASIANQVQAAIADMSKIQLPLVQNQRCAGCPHAVENGMSYGISKDACVGCGKRFNQCRLRIVTRTLIVDFANGFHGEATGFLTAFVSAHAVGDDSQSSFALKFGVACRLPIKE